MNCNACEKNALGKREKPLSLYLDIALALCSAFALVLDMNVRSGNNYVNWVASLPGTPVVAVLFAALLFAQRKAKKALPSLGAETWALSVFLGFWWVLVQSVANTQELNQPFLSSGQVLKTVIMTLGMANLYRFLFGWMLYALDQGDAWRPHAVLETKPVSRLAAAYRNHTVLSCMAVILLAWLPHFVAAFPCAMNSDSVAQLWEWTGVYQFSTHHPPFGTLLIGMAYETGLLLGDGAIGLALYVAVQMLLAAAVLGYSQDVMRRLGAPPWLRLLALFAACVCPVYADNVTTIIKDVPYAYGMLMVMCELAGFLLLNEERRTASLLRMAAGGVFVMLMRNNGKYVLLPVAVCLAVWAVKNKRLRAAAGTLTAAIALSFCISAWLVEVYDIVPGSRREALSLPFQQTARFVRDHEAEIPEDERNAIDAVLGFSQLGKVYDPVISDPVKARYRSEVTAEDLQRYFSVWWKQFLRDPACYVKATVIQNILLLDPQTRNLAIFSGTGLDEAAKVRLGIAEPDTLGAVRDLEENLRDMMMSLPGMAQLNSLGFHCCILLFACLWSLRKRRGGMLLLLLPLLLSMLVIVAGPCIQNQDRYGFPIVYCMPLALACLSDELRKTKDTVR